LIDLLAAAQAEQFAQFVLGPLCHADQEAAAASCATVPLLHQTVEILPAAQVEVAHAEVGVLRDLEGVLQGFEQVVFNVVKDARHGALLLFLVCAVSPHAVLDVVVNDEIQFFISEAVMPSEYTIYLVDDRL